MAAERAEVNRELADIVVALADLSALGPKDDLRGRVGRISAWLHIITTRHPLAKDDCPYCMGEG